MNELVEKSKESFSSKKVPPNEENKFMTKFCVSTQIDPIISLNVGGEVFTTRQSTLKKIPETVLALSLDAPWTESFARDHLDRLFLDFDPNIFRFLLDQLRTWNSSKKTFRLPKDGDQRDSFKQLCHQLHFPTTLYEGSDRVDKFNKICGHILLEGKGLIARHVGTYRYAECRGTNTYSTGIHRIFLGLQHHTMETFNTFIGIIWSSSPMQENSFELPTAYGWAGRGQVYLRGVPSSTIGYAGYDSDICSNDLVELVLNCQLATISLFNHRTKKRYEIPVDVQQGCPFPWQLHVNLYAPEDSVQIFSPK